MAEQSATLRAGSSAAHLSLQGVAACLGRFNYRYSSEVQLHDRLESVLLEGGFAFTREHVLDAKNRADFLMADGLVIEVKVDGPMSEALRQVNRYIHLPAVTGVLLASTERWAEQPLKKRPSWGGKPFSMIRLRRQAL